MGVEVGYSDSNAEADTISGNSRCTSLGSQSGRFYANVIRACMIQCKLVLLLSPSHIYSDITSIQLSTYQMLRHENVDFLCIK